MLKTHLDARFYRVGGGTRVAGFLLAVATTVLLLIGTGPIAYIRKSRSPFGCVIFDVDSAIKLSW